MHPYGPAEKLVNDTAIVEAVRRGIDRIYTRRNHCWDTYHCPKLQVRGMRMPGQCSKQAWALELQQASIISVGNCFNMQPCTGLL